MYSLFSHYRLDHAPVKVTTIFCFSGVVMQGEHKNTPWFQIFIISKIAWIILQFWYLKLKKLIKFHVGLVDFVDIRCVPLLLLGKNQGDNQVRPRLVPAYRVWWNAELMGVMECVVYGCIPFHWNLWNQGVSLWFKRQKLTHRID